MREQRLTGIIQAAIAEGLLSAAAAQPVEEGRPWPVVLLTGLGAWLAALPLLGVVGLLFGDWLNRSAGLYVVGLLLLAAAIVVLRASDVPLFVEQLAVPALLVGGGSLGFGLSRDLDAQVGSAILCIIALGAGAAIARPWLRVLLGAAAAVLLVIACIPARWHGADLTQRLWFAWHVSLAVWLCAAWVQRSVLNDGARAHLAAALESLGAGWLLATLVGLAWWSGRTFLFGAGMGGGFAGEVIRETAMRSSKGWEGVFSQSVSLLLAVAAALWAARHWPRLRIAANAGVALVLTALAWFMPALGAVWLALAHSVTTARWRLGAAAALAAAWIVGAFYYQLQWSLATKSAVLISAGAVLGGLAWLASRQAGTPAAAPSKAARTPATRASRAAITSSALAMLVVANVGIWQKEALIARGQPVYVELAPADPRSLMQGDFMRLNFRIPGEVQSNVDALLTSQRPRVIARRDARGVATLLRIDAGTPLGADELRIELTPKHGRWILVSDAWFFKEGEAKRWQAAKYGEFRVEPSGRAVLVGLRGANLEPL